MSLYKGFTYNETGVDPAPWGAIENQLDKDIIDTLVEDCVEETIYTAGHRHFKLYTQTSGNLALTIATTGIGSYVGGVFDIESYSTTLADAGKMSLRHSHHATLQTLAATGDGEVLGEINFYGVNNVPAWDAAAKIISTQVGATDSQIGADIAFFTAVKAGALTQKMTLTDVGKLGIGIASPTAQLDISHSVTLVLGADDSATTRTDATDKYAKISVPHYTNAEENMAFMIAKTKSGANELYIGGGITSAYNAATLISFYTGATSTTTTGTERLRITDVGDLGLGTTTPLLNIGTAAGDLTGGGVHIKSDISSDETAYLVIEGDSTASEGIGTYASSIIFCDNAGAVDTKLVEIRTYNQILEIVSLDDDISQKRSYVLFGGGATVFNSNQVDMDHRFASDLYDDSLFVEGSSGNCGIGTQEPFNDIGGGTGLGAGEGLHVVANGAETQAALAITGWGASIYLADTNGGADDKIMQFIVDGGVGVFQSLDDDMTSNINNILSMDLGTGRVSFSKSISSGTLIVTTGTYDALDVTGVNTLFIDTSGGNVTLGGTVGGVDGQILNIAVHDSTGNTTVEDQEGTGNQDFYLHKEADEALTAEPGGWVFVNEGGNHWHDVSHAQHV